MTDASYFHNDELSSDQHPDSSWQVLVGGAATMFAMATIAMLWV